ncbi:MAG: glycosyltransferase family 4 protein [Candidatus Moranbacteria bacterium]|nr:glycosyltransferase family 4 protein [Candidatus Moranbacteria bacterium]
MRIGIDARFYGPVGKGLGRYTEELIRNLESVASDKDRFFVFLRKENFDAYVPKKRNFIKVLADFPWYSFREQTLFPVLLYGYDLDLVHFPHFNVPISYVRPFVVTIHDLILLHFPTVRNTTRSVATYWAKYLAYRLTIGSAVRRARKILTVSRFTESDILGVFPSAAGKTVVAYEGSGFSGRHGAPSGSEHGIMKPFFLYVGNAYPHKNLEAFIPLAKRFPRVSFVLVGKEDHFYRRLREEVGRESVTNMLFPGFVPDERLVSLYRDATGYVFPSLYEGFGLPPLEAMSFGTPVIAAKRGSLPEILGDAALYFDPDDPDSLVRAVETVLTDEDVVARLFEKGKARSASFDWNRMAEETLRTYAEALDR